MSSMKSRLLALTGAIIISCHIGLMANSDTVTVKQPSWQRWEQNEEKNHWQIGIRTAAVASMMQYTSTYYDGYHHKPYGRGAFGIWAERDIVAGLSFRPELAFTGRGDVLTNGNIDYSLHARYCDLRFNFLYTFLQDKRVQPYVLIGPNLNFVTGGSIRYYNRRNEEVSTCSLSKGNINPFNLSIMAGIGLRFPVEVNNFPFYIGTEFNYNIGVLNTFSKAERNNNLQQLNVINNTYSDIYGARLNHNWEFGLTAGIPLSSFKHVDRAPRPQRESWAERMAREREAKRAEREAKQRQQEELLALLKQQQANNENRYNEALAAFNQNMTAQNRVGDGIKMYVVPSVALETADDGSQEMNLKMEFTYETKPMETQNLKYDNNTDDYPSGKYLPTQSKACKTTLNFLKEQLSGEMKKYFTPNTKVTIKIVGETDGSAIRSRIPYKGEFGDFHNEMIYLNNSIDEITVTRQGGITSNGQLAFLRTQGVKQFLETYVDELKVTQNTYQIYAVEREEKGSQFRRISVEFTIHNAYAQEMRQAISAVPVQDADGQKSAGTSPGSAGPTEQQTVASTPKQQPAEDVVSDVDTDIPISKRVNSDTYVLIIANEHYKDIIGVVPFAENDGKVFKQYCVHTLGIPERQIRMAVDATRNEISDALDWLENLAQARNGSGKFIIYYAGHGIPINEVTYLLPVDGNPEKANQLLSLHEMYQRLGKMPAQQVTCLLDACFSGTRRNGQPIVQGGRGIAMKPKQNTVEGNLVIFSAADASQTAYPYAEKKHGLFTYFLLKALQAHKGNITYQNLIGYLTEQVSVEASLQNRKQTPTLQYSETIEEQWGNWTLF